MVKIWKKGLIFMSKIISVKGYELFDSRGNPTVGARVETESGAVGFSVVPSGASTGKYEAVELRDGGKRLCGKGVRLAVKNINSLIAPTLLGMDVSAPQKADKAILELDGTEDKRRLGANAVLAVSVALYKAAAEDKGVPLYRYFAGEYGEITMPLPMMNILNGGAHASNNIDIQEFMIKPIVTSSFSESMEICAEIYHTLKKLLAEKGRATAVGDEGGFAPDLSGNEEAIELIVEAIEKAGYSTDRVKLCLDVAASEWAEGNGYFLPKSKKRLTRDELISYLCELSRKYPICSIEDGLCEEDLEGTAELTKRLGEAVQIVGDDLFVTNKKRLQEGIEAGAANAILIKPNQIGSVSETLEVIRRAKEKGYKTVISHRSGDTEDTFIADLAAGVSAGQIKTGAPCRSERTAKYNRLLFIEQENFN